MLAASLSSACTAPPRPRQRPPAVTCGVLSGLPFHSLEVSPRSCPGGHCKIGRGAGGMFLIRNKAAGAGPGSRRRWWTRPRRPCSLPRGAPKPAGRQRSRARATTPGPAGGGRGCSRSGARGGRGRRGSGRRNLRGGTPRPSRRPSILLTKCGACSRARLVRKPLGHASRSWPIEIIADCKRRSRPAKTGGSIAFYS